MEGGLPLRLQPRYEYFHRRSVHNLLWEPIPARDYSGPEGMLATSGDAPLLVSLKSMATKPRAGGDNKDCVQRKTEKAVCYFVHASKVSTNYSTG